MLTGLLLAMVFTPPAQPVTAAVYTPSGKLLAAAARSTVHLYDAAGELLADLPPLSGRVTALAAGPGVLVVAAGETGRSGVVRLFDIRDACRPQQMGEPLTAHTDAIYALSVSPDGRSLATAGYDRLVKVWDVPPADKPRHVLTDHSDTVYGAAFSPDGRLLATAAADRTVKVWDAASGKRLFTLGEPADAVHAVVWHPAGTHLLAAGADKSLRVWAVTPAGGALVKAVLAHDRPIRRLVMAGGTAWTASDDRTVKGFDPLTLAERRTLLAAPDDLLALAVSPDGKRAAAGRYDGNLTLLDLGGDAPAVVLLPAKPKPPVVDGLSADAVACGRTVRLLVRGKHLGGVTAVVADRPGVTLTIAAAAAGELSFDVTAAASVPVGPVALTLKTPGGDVPAGRVWVDQYPAVERSGAADTQPVTLPATVVGRLDRTGAADGLRFVATVGQQVGFVLTAVDGATLDPVLEVADAAGRLLATGGNKVGVTCPAAGAYTVTVRDRQYRGGAKLGYRLHAGPLPVVTGVFPLAVTRGTTQTVTLAGVNLPAASVQVTVTADAPPGGKVPVPGTDATVSVGEFPAVPATDAGTLAVPGTADGRLARPGEQHAVRFRADKGRPLVLVVDAARLGSPLDSLLEVQDASGVPVPRAVLRVVAKVSTTLRDHSATQPGIRLDTWPGFRPDDYLLAGTDLMRIKDLAKTVDDDTEFYQADGRRLGFLGATPTAHAFGADVFKVVPVPPGTPIPANGLPVVTLPYRNDDGGPGFGRDSWLLFYPPADGDYRAVVRDSNGGGGPLHAYRLTVREPRPDFTLKVTPPAKLPTGGAGTATATLTRADGFDGPVRITADGCPDTTVQAGQLVAVLPVPATVAGELLLVATASVGGRELRHTAAVKLPVVSDPADLTAGTDRPEISIRPGGQAKLTVRVQRLAGFTGRVPVEVRGLPHGVRVENSGLNGVLLTPGVTEREIVLSADPAVPAGSRPFAVVAKSERRNAEFAVPVTIRVE